MNNFSVLFFSLLLLKFSSEAAFFTALNPLILEVFIKSFSFNFIKALSEKQLC